MVWDVASLTQAFVRIPSPSGGERELAAFVRQVMVSLGFETQVDAWGNVIGLQRGRADGPVVLFDAHMDTVDLGTESWEWEPYGGEISNGRLYGRGAADTKGSLAAMLLAVSSLTPEQIRGAVLVAATVCEENLTGAALGRVLDEWQPALVITGEPTELRLGVAQKGRAILCLTAQGRSAHTSRPELGDNAVYKMIEAVQRLRALPPQMDPELGPAILELVEMASQPAGNVTLVPAGCRARFVALTLPGQTADSFLHAVRQALDSLTGVSVSIETRQQTCYTGATLQVEDFLPPWRSAPCDPWRVRLLDALAEADGSRQTFAAPCGTNASESARRGIPSFILGPGSLAQAHIADEWVELEQLAAAEKLYRLALTACFAPSRLP